MSSASHDLDTIYEDIEDDVTVPEIPTLGISGSSSSSMNKSIWDDIVELEEDPGTDAGVTALVEKFSNLVICSGLKTQEFSHREAFADMVIAACTYAMADPSELARATAAIGQMAKIIARARTVPTRDQILEAAKAPTHLLNKAARLKPAAAVERVYFGNLIPYCRRQQGTVLSVENNQLKVTCGGASVLGKVTEFGSIAWHPSPAKFIATVSKGSALYSTSGDDFTDYVIMMYVMHHRISKVGNPDGTVRVEVNARQYNPKVAALPKFPDAVNKSMSIVAKFFGVISSLIRAVSMTTWTGDPTPHMIAAFGPRAIIPGDKKAIIYRHLKTFSNFINGVELNIPFTVKSMLGNKEALTAVNSSEGKPANVIPILDTCRGYRGSQDDIANTTLKDGIIPYWWLGRSVSTTMKWQAVVEELKPLQPSVTCAIGCVSDTDKWSEVISELGDVRKYDLKAKTNVSELDIMSDNATLPECDIILSDVYVPPPSSPPKNMSPSAVQCNAQEKVLESIMMKAVAAKAKAVAVKMFPWVVEKAITMNHVQKVLETYHTEFSHFAVFPGGRKHNLEFIVVLSRERLTNTVSLLAVKKQMHDFSTVLFRMTSFLAAISAQANLARNAMLHLGSVRTGVPPPALMSVIPVAPASVARQTADSYDMLSEYNFSDLQEEEENPVDEAEETVLLAQVQDTVPAKV